MSTVATALEQLDPDARERVLSWASSRFGVSPAGAKVAGGRRAAMASPAEGARPAQFADFAALFDAADPKTLRQKVLVACYWFQVCENQTELESRPMNNALKHLGHGIGSITHALDGLQATKPALVMQLQKSGKTRQARKKYRLTAAGVRAVETLLGATSVDGEET